MKKWQEHRYEENYNLRAIIEDFAAKAKASENDYDYIVLAEVAGIVNIVLGVQKAEPSDVARKHNIPCNTTAISIGMDDDEYPLDGQPIRGSITHEPEISLDIALGMMRDLMEAYADSDIPALQLATGTLLPTLIAALEKQGE